MMSTNLCQVLLIEGDPAKVELIQNLLSQGSHSSLAQGFSFVLTVVDSLEQALKKLDENNFSVILLDLTSSGSQGINALITLRSRVMRIPIIVQTDSDDETLVVESFKLGADGYLQTRTLDSNLLLYQIRLVIEKQQYISKLEDQRQQTEFRELEQLVRSTNTSITARMFGSEPLRESVPDIFGDVCRIYGDLLDLSLEQRAFKVEHNISDRLRDLADKLGFLKASPRDVIEIHTSTLREKNKDVTLAKAQAYVSEGRLMVLELMGYLTSFYRKYYIGLSTLNLFSKSDHSHKA